MARAVEQVERDIVALEEAVSAIAMQLKSAYVNYLQALESAVRQQLILASYQVCTQGYPKQFLSLSFSQRQQLQQAIRKLGQQAAEQLLTLIATGEQQINDEQAGSEVMEDSKQDEVLSLLQLTPHTVNPEEVVQWQQNVEAAITHTLKTFSLEVNRLLQQTGILSPKLPAPILEAAATASETVAEITSGPPNLLNLLIETENREEIEDINITQLVAIQLRLAEIEFADAKVTAARNQIRSIEAKLKSLGREYERKQQERTIAEAEAAWRASWFEEV